MTEIWMDVGATSDIPQLGARTVPTPIGDVAVFRNREDRFFALVDRCPHKGGPLSQGIVHGTSVACPLHNWTIDLETGEARAPDKGCTRKLPLRIVEGRIQLKIPAVLAAAA